MTKEEFEREYCDRSGISSVLYKNRLVTLECNCGSDTCNGWAAIGNDPLYIKIHKELYV